MPPMKKKNTMSPRRRRPAFYLRKRGDAFSQSGVRYSPVGGMAKLSHRQESICAESTRVLKSLGTYPGLEHEYVDALRSQPVHGIFGIPVGL